MKIFECKCGSKEAFIEVHGSNTGLYCADCGKWITWLNKDQLRLAQRQIDKQSKERETDIDSSFTDDLLNQGYTKGYQKGKEDVIKKAIIEIKKLRGYTDWSDGGCTYDELVYRNEVISVLKSC